MSNHALAAVDGTWSYRIEGMTFVRRFKNRFGRAGDVRRFFHGPDLVACRQDGIEARVYDYLRGVARNDPGARLCMIGWSRGAHACVNVANRLAREGVRVHWLGMFDAVDMRIDWGEEIRTVMASHVVHLSRRDADDRFVGRDYWAMNLVAYRPGPFTRSLVRRSYDRMTHSSMGGCESGPSSGAVWTDMLGEAQRWGVPVT